MKLSIAVTNYSWPSGNDAIADALQHSRGPAHGTVDLAT
jgi:hypothetical protein